MRAETLSVYLCPFYVLTPYCSGVRHGAGKPVELGHHQCVAAAHRRERLIQARPGPVCAGKAAIGVNAISSHAELQQGVFLCREVLLIGRAAGVADESVHHARICNVRGSFNARNIVPFI